ncbi:hypothetical protein [Chryseobacterium indologenes]|uniref:hypothetical protein n=1 Tax=Chryseobacterium indologenes TaxID=253 RepID=UPI000B51CC7E|nr:hypothetical protein [Chryseobacterium indologenes]ASE61845.1 hypothetical protein CEQ15_10295 [Chryseobacterium indologenes]ATN05783.1 hypothetical protein CRN76_10450 [Chryseobacterium indologenes]AYY85459.1 hypothetical protein EGX91_13295 [Chryseobacterium indologenes]QIX82355.1 hypothetical protein FOB56_14370 [Chryseobacterium indologenes]UDQ51990.1 hypothetical protein LJF28_11145 [Chryseobacterium indologenes]
MKHTFVRKTLAVSFFCILLSVDGQVGINTKKPQSTLDVNGNVSIRNEFRVGGTPNTQGNPGTNNQILVSQGTGNAPQWKTAKVDFYEEGQYRSTASMAISDNTGINFGNANLGDNITTSNLNEDITGTTPIWTEIPGLASSFSITYGVNEVNFVFQTGVEMSNINNDTSKYVRYMCGIFIDNKLQGMRAGQINGVPQKNQKTQSIFTLNYTLENLSVGTHTAKIGCRRMASTLYGTNLIPHFAIGRPTTDGTQISNNFMMSSALKYDVFEMVTVTL